MQPSTSRSIDEAVTLKTMLLVDDNGDDEALVRRVLKKNGRRVRVVAAKDGLEALQMLRARPGPGQVGLAPATPSIVLLDLKMPRMGGLEVLRALSAEPRFRLLPIVVFSSSTEASDIEDSYRLGACSFVHKPVDYEAFERTVLGIVDYWLVVNRAPTGAFGANAVERFAY